MKKIFKVRSRTRNVRIFDVALFATAFIILGLIFVPGFFAKTQKSGALAAVDPTTIPACNGNSECFAWTIDLKSTYANTGNNYCIPIASQPGGIVNQPIAWKVSWGDGTLITVSGVSNGTLTASDGASNGSCVGHKYGTYTGSETYQIAIQPLTNTTNNQVPAPAGWMNAFGTIANDSVTTGYQPTTGYTQAITSLDTPLTNLSRTSNISSRFGGMFSGLTNLGAIPSNLFANIDTSTTTDFSHMFGGTFVDTPAVIPSGLFANINTAAGVNFASMFARTFETTVSITDNPLNTIPAGLFDSLNTANGTNFSQMFNNTFFGWTTNTSATIPSGLFAKLDLSLGTTFNSMFLTTFGDWKANVSATIPADLFAWKMNALAAPTVDFTSMFTGTFRNWTANTAATIPTGLFAKLNTSDGTNFSAMFFNTFASWTANSFATIPTGLFDSLNTANGIGFNNMFYNTFLNWNKTQSTIPGGLFAKLNTSNGLAFNQMFRSTFQGWTVDQNVVLPTNFFANIDTSKNTWPSVLTQMYYQTFASSFSRKIDFSLNGQIVETQNFFLPSAGLYQITNITHGGNPGFAGPGDVMAVGYDSTNRAPTMPTAGNAGKYDWYKCSVPPQPYENFANDPNCVEFLFVDSGSGLTVATDEWFQTFFNIGSGSTVPSLGTDPMVGNLILYGGPNASIGLTTDQSDNSVMINTTTQGIVSEKTTTATITGTAFGGYSAYLTMDSKDGIGVTGSAAGDPNGTSTDNSLHNGSFSLAGGDLTADGEWGVHGGLISGYTAVPLNGTSFTFAKSSVSPATTGDITTLTFGARAGAGTASGTYTGNVLYTVVPNP
jgi:hypothetical protein